MDPLCIALDTFFSQLPEKTITFGYGGLFCSNINACM
jgi:hypothetical protein